MIKNTILAVIGFVLSFAVMGVSPDPAFSEDVPRITKEELKEKLGNPDVVIVDVRIGKDWKASEFKIKGAVRADPKKITSWAEKQEKEKTLVLYCA